MYDGGALIKDQDESTGEQRFAKAFSNAFLMPAAGVRRRFNELVESNHAFTPRHLRQMPTVTGPSGDSSWSTTSRTLALMI